MTARPLLLVLLAGAALVVGCFSAPTERSCEEDTELVRPCGACGTKRAHCVGGQFGPFAPCVEPNTCDTTPDSGSASWDSGSASSDAGTVWVDGGSGERCQNGDILTRACGNCGYQQRTCQPETWGSWSPCQGMGECAAGAVEAQACGITVGACVGGTRSRSCGTTCSWNDWGSCEGAYVGPSPEFCGDAVDNDCNGAADEGCRCTPVARGAGGSLALTGTITKLIADPNRCVLYALNAGTPSQVVVIDTSSKAELARVTLPQAATDLDVSPDGGLLVASHDVAHQISTIEPGLWMVASTVPVASDPYRVEVDDRGRVYYVEYEQWTDLRRVDLPAGVSSDVLVGSGGMYAGDAELSPDGAFLFVGESGIPGGSLIKYDVSGGALQKVDESTWGNSYGFPYLRRALYLAPNARHIYYSGYQLDADHLSQVRGRTGETVFAEDRAGTFSVGQNHVFDAQLVRAVAPLPHQATAAALASADHELWYFSADTGRLYYQNIDDLIWGVELGQRDRTPGPLSSYHFAKLAVDPLRDRLYGLDPQRESVVLIDAVSRAAISEVVVGSLPTALSVDAEGKWLFVGHSGVLALARIDLVGGTFDRFLPTPSVPYEVVALSSGRVATIDEAQWTSVTLLNGETGAVLATSSSMLYKGALTAPADGKTLFVGEANLSAANLFKFDVSAGALTQVGRSSNSSSYGFTYPRRLACAVPDGSGVYYASHLLDGANLTILKYPQTDPIYSVTPDSRLAISATKVYRVSDGTLAGSLPIAGTVQTVSSDGGTLYLAGDSGISSVDLSVF